MDTHSPNPPDTEAATMWPAKPAVRGKFYGVTDPMFKTDQLCVMTMETWVDVGTILKQHEQVMAQQAAKITELMATNSALSSQVNDANSRLSNLRDVRRKEMRHQLEGDLVLPGQRDFFTNPPRKS